MSFDNLKLTNWDSTHLFSTNWSPTFYNISQFVKTMMSRLKLIIFAVHPSRADSRRKGAKGTNEQRQFATRAKIPEASLGASFDAGRGNPQTEVALRVLHLHRQLQSQLQFRIRLENIYFKLYRHSESKLKVYFCKFIRERWYIFQ